MAQFVVHLRFTPADYYAMTMEQREAIVTEQARAAKRRR